MSTDTPPAELPAARPASVEVRRRRTIAVISHPDAGKTTLTENLLATTGLISRAGMVKSRSGSKTTSDWMALERERGISVTSSAVRIETEIATINLLDTPGHGDFSEDTYRVLSAVDAAIMLIDAAKGIEPQTRRLFEVCRARHTPIITFINKMDRPAREPLDLLNEIEQELDLVTCPLTWPVGESNRFSALLSLPDRARHMLPKATVTPTDAEWQHADELAELAWEAAGGFDRDAFLAGTTTAVIWGAAVRGSGVADLLRVIEEIAPAPAAMLDENDTPRALDDAFSGFVFKLQSNMDPRHRDISAFIRICSGTFERGMKANIARTGRSLLFKQAHEPFGRDRMTIETAFPGDVIVVPNATDLRIGDTLHTGSTVTFPRLRVFAPTMFATVVNTDTGRRKQFQKGLEQLTDEGVVQLLIDPNVGRQRPVAAAAGDLQYEVFLHRMRDEFNVDVRLDRLPYEASAQTNPEDAATIRTWPTVRVLERTDGTPLALFPTRFSLDGRRRTAPEMQLDDLLA